MKIKILGTGCPKCKALEKNTRDAVAKLGIEAEVIKVDDIMDIMNFGVVQTPALVIDEKVVLKGRVPTVDEIEQLIQN